MYFSSIFVCIFEFSNSKSEFNPGQRPAKLAFMFQDKANNIRYSQNQLGASVVFTGFPYFNPFNYEPSPIRCFLRNHSRVYMYLYGCDKTTVVLVSLTNYCGKSCYWQREIYRGDLNFPLLQIESNPRVKAVKLIIFKYKTEYNQSNSFTMHN